MLVADKIRLLVACTLVVLGIAGYYFLADAAAFVRVLSVIGGLIGAGGVMFTSHVGQQFVVFWRESINEAKKVVWPTRRETLQITGAVFAFAFVLAIFLWVVDAGLSWLFYDVILRRGG